MVGDRYFDIVGANNVGIESVGVLYGYGSREEFLENKANYIVESVVKLRELLLGEES
jgi:phosphoglycolate phosphatase